MPEQEQTFQNYDRYISELFASEDEALRAAREEARREGLPGIHVSPSEGKLLHVLARMAGARRILEVGTLGGYSAIWLARALPEGGRMISLEIDPHHAEVARRNVERAGLSGKVEVRVGPASESLAQLQAAGEAQFDLVFIDADKDGYVDYLKKAVPLTRAGGLILGDNTLPDAVLDPAADSGTKRYNAAVAAHPDLVSILIPVLRGHGLDGLLVSIKAS
ncbi:MAG: O-methyltransferase [Armatimonadetes bacterium]|nr:O-methyltransferase [Armatimonadota bacterium]